MQFPKLKDIRRVFDFYSKRADFLLDKEEDRQIDFDVFLPTYGRNLQRSYFWDSFQQQEYIWSLIYQRFVPSILYVYISNTWISEYECIPKYKIIDGKQRLTTHRNFMLDAFPLIVEGTPYLFSELPEDWQWGIQYCYYNAIEVRKDYARDISDDELLELFKWANFAGTPQEKNYLNQFVKICK